jgi:hypothetical protein
MSRDAGVPPAGAADLVQGFPNARCLCCWCVDAAVSFDGDVECMQCLWCQAGTDFVVVTRRCFGQEVAAS